MMKIIKNILIILTVTCMILLTTYNMIYAATYDQKSEVVVGISTYINGKYPNIYDKNLSTPESQAAINDIAKELKRLCDKVGIPVTDMEAADDDLGWPGVTGNNEVITLIIRAAKNPNLGDQTEKPEETEDKKRELANTIRQRAANGITNMSTTDLLELDALLNQFRTTYPGAWSPNDSEYYDIYYMAVDVNNEIIKRKSDGDNEIPDGYVTTLGEQVKDREEEQENLRGGGVSGLLGKSDASTEHTPNDIIQGALDFKNSGDTTIPIDQNNIKKGYSTVYNILLSIGLFLAIAIGMYLGVKFMLANAEDKAKIKEAIIPYTAGCIIIFGAFVIWKLAIILLSGIEKVSDLPIRNEYVIAKQIDEK